MLLMTTLRTRAGRRSLPIDDTGQVLLGQAEFERVLAQERERSDRNSHGFQMVLLDVHALDDAGFAKVVRVLARRARRADTLGWYDWSHVGVILADARSDRAGRLLQAIGPDLVASAGRIVPARVFAYGEDHAALRPSRA